MKYGYMHVIILALAATNAFAETKAGICKDIYGYYYERGQWQAKTSDQTVAQAQCAAGAKQIADDEVVINMDLLNALKKARIDPDSYRGTVANAIQMACLRNTLNMKPMAYPQFESSQCKSLSAKSPVAAAEKPVATTTSSTMTPKERAQKTGQTALGLISKYGRSGDRQCQPYVQFSERAMESLFPLFDQGQYERYADLVDEQVIRILDKNCGRGGSKGEAGSTVGSWSK